MTSDESSAAERVFAIIDLAPNIAEHVGGREAWRMMSVSQAARAGVKEWLRRLVVEEERAGETNAWELVELPRLAARKGLETVVRVLVAAGADVDRAGEDCSTPLHIAAE